MKVFPDENNPLPEGTQEEIISSCYRVLNAMTDVSTHNGGHETSIDILTSEGDHEELLADIPDDNPVKQFWVTMHEKVVAEGTYEESLVSLVNDSMAKFETLMMVSKLMGKEIDFKQAVFGMTAASCTMALMIGVLSGREMERRISGRDQD